MSEPGTTKVSDSFLSRLRSKEYRDAYMESFTRQNIASQIRHLRGQRNITQKELASQANKRQGQISRLESASHGTASLQSLMDLAAAFDVALTVKFVPIDEFLVRTQVLGPEYYEAPPSEDVISQMIADRTTLRGEAPERVLTQEYNLVAEPSGTGGAEGLKKPPTSTVFPDLVRITEKWQPINYELSNVEETIYATR